MKDVNAWVHDFLQTLDRAFGDRVRYMLHDKYFKLEIFIPESHFEDLRKSLQSVDAGHIGNYDCCLSYSRVIGTWRPLPGTDPFIGEEGVISEEEELKVEVTVTGSRLDETIVAIKEVHPYEEPVINVIELYRTGL